VSDALRRWILRVLIIVGYVPNLAFFWLVGEANWRAEFHAAMRRLWSGRRLP